MIEVKGQEIIVDTTTKPTKETQASPTSEGFFKRNFYRKKTTNVVRKGRKFEKNLLNKPIRNIIIKTDDPFGYSLQDTTARPTKWVEKTGNSIHLKTKPYVLREILLFKKGDDLDSLKIRESERLLRNQKLYRRVEIKPILTENNDSVDVYVNAIDSWSMVVTATLSTKRGGIQIRERNFLGLGHILYNRFRHDYQLGKSLYHFNYTVPNIAKTRIIANVNYFKNEDQHYNKGITFTRPFYSPLAKWAGGVGVGQSFFQDSLDYNKTELEYHNFKFNYTDVWAAKAFRIGENKKGMISNFIVSTRYYQRSYKEKPNLENDPYNFFSNQNDYFLGLGISSRKYTKDQFIFNNGIDEDIAEGYVFGVTGAIQDREKYDRGYLGGRASYGRYLKNKNYIGAEVQYGSFFRNKKSEQTVFNFHVLYFSHLLNLNKWKIRQFTRVNYTVGAHRWDTPADELSLHEHDYAGLDGIRRARGLLGDQKLILEFQTQTYSPYEFLGFRVSPFFNAAIGIISNKKENSLFDKDNALLRLGVGVTFSNDYFVFNNVRISFSFYPKIPGEGLNLLKTNVIDNRDFELMDYSFDKPSYIRWNRWD